MKLLVTLKNHWKKSIFGTVLLGYAYNYAYTSYRINDHMVHVCAKVRQQYNNKDLKHIVVIINPTAHKKKSEQLFKKYCEPLLHLAGYSVEIWKTNYVGHAKTLIEEMPRLPDGIVVAGGDGTCSEVVTGLLRRNYGQCPLVFLPLGTHSSIARKYLDKGADTTSPDKFHEVCGLTDAILQLVYGIPASESVIKYDVIATKSGNNEKDETKPEKALKPIYGLNKFSWGLLRDIESIQDKYWYFGPMRHYAAVIFNSLSSRLNWKFSTEYIQTPPCEGCRFCASLNITAPDLTVRPGGVLNFRGFLPIAQQTSRKELKDLPINDNCNTESKGNLTANQIVIKKQSDEHNAPELQMQVVDSFSPGFNFIKHTNEIVHNKVKPSNVLSGRTIRFLPIGSENGSFYAIDGEEYDVRPIQITLLQNAIKVFRSKE